MLGRKLNLPPLRFAALAIATLTPLITVPASAAMTALSWQSAIKYEICPAALPTRMMMAQAT